MKKGPEKGLAEGEIRAHREDLFALLEERFGSVSPAVEARIQAVSDAARLRAALRQVLRIASPDELPL